MRTGVLKRREIRRPALPQARRSQQPHQRRDKNPSHHQSSSTFSAPPSTLQG
jgi:hypothetical protein